MAAEASKSFLEYLPTLFRQSRLLEAPTAAPSPAEFLGRFLLAFEHILSRRPNEPDGLARCPELKGIEGLERRIECGHEYIHVDKAPRNFLPWLAGWVATRVREDMPEPAQRAVIKAAVRRHQCRGTMKGIKDAIEAALDHLNDESAPPGSEVRIEESPQSPHVFRVTLTLTTTDSRSIETWVRQIQALIAREKPAHTCCELEVETPNIQYRLWESREEHPHDSIVVGEYWFPVNKEP
jgi:phage tail-like protein